MVEPLKEEVEVLLIDGNKKKVQIKKYLGAREQDKIMQKLTAGLKIKPNQKNEDMEVDASKAMAIFGDLAEAIWADKNTSLDDVEGDSLRNVLMERFNTFLGRVGFSAEAGNSKSSQ
jgi:hypothetical protein